MTMRHVLTSAFVVGLLLGCGNSELEKMSSAAPPPWEALAAFQEEPLRSVAYPKEMGNWNAVKAALTSAQFSAALEAFEKSETPSDYSAKQPQKDALVKTWRDAIEAAKMGPQDELKAKVEAAITATSQLQATN